MFEKKTKVRVLFELEKQYGDELGLIENETISIIKAPKNAYHWAFGECQGLTGWYTF